MKRQYLDEIRKLLGRYVITDAEIDDIIADYDRMYEDGLARGMNDATVIDFLGKPEKIVRELGDSYSRKPGRGAKNGKIIALTPFIAVIVYFFLGFGLGAWHPGWLVFFLIPVTAIVLGNEERNLMSTLTALSPFAAVGTFFVLGEVFGAWHPGWLVFLLIPIVGALSDRKWKGYVFAALLVLSAGIYLYFGYTQDAWALGALAFVIPLVFGAAVGAVDTFVEWKTLGSLPRTERNFKIAMILVVFGAVALYVALGIAFLWWGYAWLVFLAIPMFAILAKAGSKGRIVALSPFIATILFFLLGFIFQAWAYAWIVFLLIPMTAIIKNA